MSGMEGDFDYQSPAEASDPITPAQPNPRVDSAESEPRSASSVAEQMRAPMQPGDTVPITRRISDIPVSQQTGRAGDAGEGFNVGQTAGEGQTAEEEDQEMLKRAQEMVGKALGGGSRGAS